MTDLATERDALAEQLDCVRQALPMEWRDSVPSVAIATLVAEASSAYYWKERAEANAKDAKRYHKLTASGNFSVGTFGGWGLRCGGPPATKAELDAAVDALPPNVRANRPARTQQE